MKRFRYHWKKLVTVTTVFVLLGTGVILSCGGGGESSDSSDPGDPGTGTVVITGRIL